MNISEAFDLAIANVSLETSILTEDIIEVLRVAILSGASAEDVLQILLTVP